MSEVEIDNDFVIPYHNQARVTSFQDPVRGIIRRLSSAFETIRTYKIVQDRLVDGFNSAVGDIALNDVLVSYDDRPIRHPEKFGFIAIRGKLLNGNTILPAGDVVAIPKDIRCTYTNQTRFNRPYLDAGLAIGLTYSSNLIAVSSAGLDRRSNLKIVQIQDVTSVSKKFDGKDYYKTGLHNGLAWRETLVKSWELIAHGMGIARVIIQSNANNTWNSSSRTVIGYDETAINLGYSMINSKNESTRGNWQKKL